MPPAAIYAGRTARVSAAVRSPRFAGVVRRAGADPSAAKSAAQPAGQRSTGQLPGACRPLPVKNAASFPLVRRHATRYVLPGLALVGDAAHHQSAGRAGVNLGYRDVDALIDTLVDARSGAALVIAAGSAALSPSALQR